MNFEIQKILEFHDLYPSDKDLDIMETLRKYDRLSIVKIVIVLGHSYGNAFIPDVESTFFSDLSKGHIPDINRRINKVFKKFNVTKICYTTVRTSLELMRYAFSIPVKDYLGTGKKQDVEYDLFRVILMINEKLMAFTQSDYLQLDELVYFNLFVSNDTNKANISQIFRTQLYYALSLFEFLEKYHTDLLNTLVVDKWRIKNYKAYIRTVYSLFVLWQQELAKKQKGCPMLDLNILKDNELIIPKVVENLAISIVEYIPFANDDPSQRDNNVDYRAFRSKPLVKVGENQYYIYNGQILIERLYNSLFFDLKEIWKDGNFINFYNKEYVEGYLFRNAMKDCINSGAFSFPTNEMIEELNMEEKDNQPDFYIRNRDALILLECKAFKIDGNLKDKADMNEFLRILKLKLYLAVENIDSKRKKKNNPEKVGVTQLVEEMDMIEDDKFVWDENIPDAVEYYPVIAIEDSRFVQPGLMSMVNRWAKDLLQEHLPDAMVHPFVITSIDTLFIHSEQFRKKGFPQVLSEFYSTCLVKKNGDDTLNAFADFNSYINRKYNLSNEKREYFNGITEKILNKVSV